MPTDAVEATPFGEIPDPDDSTANSFLDSFESEVGGIPSEDTERSSEPTPEPATNVAAPAPTPETPDAPPSGDPVPQADGAHEIAPPEGTPFPYTVNGQSKTADWILKVGDDGAVIPQEHVGKLADLIQRDEWQREQNAKLYAETQRYEALTHKVGENEYRGAEAFRQLQAERAMLDASGGKMMGMLADPAFVTNLAIAYQEGDQAKVNAILAPMIEQVKFAGERAQFDTLRTYAQKEAESQTATTTQQTQAQEFETMVGQIGKALPALTPDDLKELREYFAEMPDKIFRPATPAEAQQLNIRPGTIIRDPSLMNRWAQSRASIRQQAADAQKAADAARKENLARQPAPVPPKSNGKKPVAKKSATPASEARFEGDDGSYQAWKNRLQTGQWAHDSVET